jgi:colanic acid biosynthesis glycosyl transferase WcaI
MSMTRKRILVLGTNYFPEPIGIPRYTTEMADDMARNDHAVTVIAAAPLYPTWKRQPGYRYSWYSKEVRNSVTVWRVPTYVPINTGFVHRALYELVFFAFSLPLVVWFLLRGADALVITAPPLALCADLLLPMGKVRKAVVIKDLQIDIADNMGIIRGRGILNVLYRIEHFLLNRADMVTCVSQGMLNKVVKKGLTRPSLSLFPDWADTERLVKTSPEIAAAKRRQLGLPLDKIVVGYSGNLARKQGIELLVEMAARLRDRGRSDVQFFIGGDGPAKTALCEMVSGLGLDNVIMAPLQPESELPAMLSAIDVHVVTQKDEVSDLVLPSKMFNIMSCSGAQVITAPDGSAIDAVMTRSGAGIRVRREDKDGLEAAILRLCDSAQMRQEAGRNGRAYVLSVMLKRVILDKFYAQLFPGPASV